MKAHMRFRCAKSPLRSKAKVNSLNGVHQENSQKFRSGDEDTHSAFRKIVKPAKTSDETLNSGSVQSMFHQREHSTKHFLAHPPRSVMGLFHQGNLVLKNREDLRNVLASGKLPFHPDWRHHFAYIKSRNPIVENLLHSAATLAPPAPVAQNWCAKCNTTFRMTSDLVYHMRAHHRQEGDKRGVVRVKGEKLRCGVCGDKFKERHHLTRHMTSHQNVPPH